VFWGVSCPCLKKVGGVGVGGLGDGCRVASEGGFNFVKKMGFQELLLGGIRGGPILARGFLSSLRRGSPLIGRG